MVDDFDIFRNICLEIYQLDPAKFLSAPALAWSAALKKSEVKLDLSTDTDLLNWIEFFLQYGWQTKGV